MTDHRSYIGIDPGIKGGIAILRGGQVAATMRMPTMRHHNKMRPDIQELDTFLRDEGIYNPEALPIVILERASTRPMESGAQGLSIGISFGMIIGLIQARKLPLRTPTPQKWQKHIHGMPTKDKAATIGWVKVAYPNADLIGSAAKTAKIHDGVCDAIALAHYGMETYK